MMPTPNIPTSDMEGFKKQLLNPNIPMQLGNQINNQQMNGIQGGTPGEIQKLQKSVVLSFLSDSTGCGHIRNIFPMTYMNSQYGKQGLFNLILSHIPIMQPEILVNTRTIYFQRWMAPQQIPIVKQYKDMQKRLGYKMVGEIDDFIWKGTHEGEHIPPYNFGAEGITDDVRKSCTEIMKYMDIQCVSTEFLKKYIKEDLKIETEIKVVPNVIPAFFWGPDRRKPIKEKIKYPKVMYTGSPTHYFNQKKLMGDWENSWREWVIKNVRDNKIRFYCMGGLPFFFECLNGLPNFKIIDWVNSYQYHLPIKAEKPEFSIGPLVPNYFNYSKSDLKAIESYAYGSVFIGSVFNNGFPSPYDNCPIHVDKDISLEELDKLFWSLTEPEKYNETIKKQYSILDNEGRWLESPKYIELLNSIF